MAEGFTIFLRQLSCAILDISFSTLFLLPHKVFTMQKTLFKGTIGTILHIPQNNNKVSSLPHFTRGIENLDKKVWLSHTVELLSVEPKPLFL